MDLLAEVFWIAETRPRAGGFWDMGARPSAGWPGRVNLPPRSFGLPGARIPGFVCNPPAGDSRRPGTSPIIIIYQDLFIPPK